MSDINQRRRMFLSRIGGMSDLAVQLLNVDGEGNLDLNMKGLERILKGKGVWESNVVVISFIGCKRKGKTFLLNSLLNYMKSVKSGSEWAIGGDPLEGFPWRWGEDRATKGLLIWSEAIGVSIPGLQQEASVVFLDPQGPGKEKEEIDGESLLAFIVSTLCSSILVYNVGEEVEESDLRLLKLLIDMGKSHLDAIKVKPFQKLEFLLRDRQRVPQDPRVGEIVARKLIEKELRELTEGDSRKTVHGLLKSLFVDVEYHMMPYPGEMVSDENFEGRLSQLDPGFLTSLQSLAGSLLSPRNLVLKEINGQEVKAKDLIHYFNVYVNFLKPNSSPHLGSSMVLATIEASNQAALSSACEAYTFFLEKYLLSGSDPSRLLLEHMKAKTKAAIIFNSSRPIGEEKLVNKFRTKLDEKLDVIFNNMKLDEKKKGISSKIETPIIQLFFLLALKWLSGLFNLVGFSAGCTLLYIFMFAIISSLLLWLYTNITGYHKEWADLIENWTLYLNKSILSAVDLYLLRGILLLCSGKCKCNKELRT